ncbi:Sec-independent protein translocase subunit TatB [Streptomyces sp. PTD5-9]|uniref:Sec-independent protein translocase subunit TatB n=1 Tax=Streptomyces sp. PTD5-9 TaxID=3120150 RepID=UPI003008044B
MFADVGTMEVVTIALLGLILFGPDKLPEFIRNTMELVARFRQFSENAKQEIRSELGPEFKDFEFEDLRPERLVRTHLLDGQDLGIGEIRDALDPRSVLDPGSDEAPEGLDAGRRRDHDELDAGAGRGPAPPEPPHKS